MFAMTVRGEDEVRGSALVLSVQRMLHVHGNETQRDRWIHRLGALPAVRTGFGARARFHRISNHMVGLA